MKKIAITGTIGSGKTKCSEILRELGYYVFDCDQVNKEMMTYPNPTFYQVIERFPDVQEGNAINHALLASLIFNDEKLKKELENMVYPSILKELFQSMDSCKDEYYFAEVPLVYESGWDKYFDGILVICVDEITRMSRMIENRNMNASQVSERMKSQMSDEEKKERATWIIENNGTIEELKEKIQSCIKHQWE